MIYTLDHEPAHVRITGAGQAKVNLLGADGRPEEVCSIGIKRSDMLRGAECRPAGEDKKAIRAS